MCDILIVDKIRVVGNPTDKGKPFERMGHKALEPKSRPTYGRQLPKGFKSFELIF